MLASIGIVMLNMGGPFSPHPGTPQMAVHNLIISYSCLRLPAQVQTGHPPTA
jgi:hypothetical protein